MGEEMIAVIGLGYVGSSLCERALNVGHSVLGVDADDTAVEESIKKFKDVAPGNFTGMHLREAASFSSSVQSVVITVPTPLGENGEADYSKVEDAAKTASDLVASGGLILVESTVAPGTLRNLVMPIAKGRSPSKHMNFGFSSERIDPGNKIWALHNTPKVIAGIDKQSHDKVSELFGFLGVPVVDAKSPEDAEFSKLLENTYRLVNIALINELSRVAAALGVNINDAIDLAATKPFGFEPFRPSSGAGGHCIPVDPVFLQDSVQNSTGAKIRMIDTAIEENKRHISAITRFIQEKMVRHPNSVCLIVGVGYKSKSSDTRMSSNLKIGEELMSLGFDVRFIDPVNKVSAGRIITPYEPEAGPNEHVAVVIGRASELSEYQEMLPPAENIFTLDEEFGDVLPWYYNGPTSVDPR